MSVDMGLAAGQVAVPGEQGYELDRFNTTVDERPALVVTVRSAADVQAAVRYAAAQGLPVAVQATGHGVTVPADGAVLINTRELTGIEIDEANRTARVEAGVRSGALVAAAAEFGLAPLNGASAGVGTVGYTLGGGLGPLGRQYGFAVDLVRSMDIVTADGALVTASPESHPDLFWAARGGRGNFGVVTALVIDLVPVARLYGGGLFFPGEVAAEVLDAYRTWVTTVPDEMSSSVALLRLPPVEALPAALRGQFVVHVRIAYTGSASDGEVLVAPLRAVASPVIDAVREMPYSEVASIHDDPTEPGAYADRTALLRSLEPETVAALLAHAQPPVVVVELRHLGGALGRVPERSSAVGHRDAAFTVFVGGAATQESLSAFDALVGALSPWAASGPFVGFLSGADVGPEVVASAYEPGSYQRLREIKKVYDPRNLFRVNHNIPPAD